MCQRQLENTIKFDGIYLSYTVKGLLIENQQDLPLRAKKV